MSEDVKPYVPENQSSIELTPDRLKRLNRLIDELKVLAESLGIDLIELLRKDR